MDARDRIGNKIDIGDRVQFKPDNGEIIGEITECVGVVLKDLRGQPVPAHIRIQIDITMRNVSGGNNFHVLKVYDPKKENKPTNED